jgi:HEAT repeat protein
MRLGPLSAAMFVVCCALAPGCGDHARDDAPAPERTTQPQAGQAAGNPDQVEATVSTLVTALGHDDDASENAVKALTALGPMVLEPLDRAIDGATEEARKDMVEVLQTLGKPALPDLLKILSVSQDMETRRSAVEALGNLRDPRAVEPLLQQYMRDDESQVRYECLTSLGYIGDPRAADLLVRETKSEDQYTRMWAMDGLCSMKHPQAVPMALVLLKDPSPYVRSQVLRSCGLRFDTPEGRRGLIDVALVAEEFGDSVTARETLERLGLRPGTGTQVWTDVRETGHVALAGEHRLRAALLLGDIGDPAAVDGLIEALHDENIYVRHHAAYLLGRVDDWRGVPALVAALEDPEPLVAVTAFNSLTWFADEGQAEAKLAVAGYAGKKPEHELPRWRWWPSP